MKVEILGTQYECRTLSAADKFRWNQFIAYEILRTWYSDLYSRVESLPTAVQVAVFTKESPPDRVDPCSLDYHRVASTPAAVRYLLGLVATDWTVEVTEYNAPKILLALRPVIFPERRLPTLDTPEKQAAAKDTFGKLEENNGG
jgi:hypothetical protein